MITPFLYLSFLLLFQTSTAILPVDWPALTVSEQSPLQYTGDGTYYGVNGDVNGSCGFNSNGANSVKMPWTSGTSITVAINDNQFAEGLSCGLCIKFRGTGTGIGTHPIPQEWTTAFVNNRCPECAPGSLDLGATGDGRWQIQWVPTSCNVGQSSFSYHTTSDSSNRYYLAFTVSNTRVPLKNVELNIGGSWAPLRRDVSNSWNSNGLTYHAPFHVRLTSVLGDVVEDYIPSQSGGQGSAQFPESKPDPAGARAGVEALTTDYPGIVGADAVPVPVHWESSNGTWVRTTSSDPASPGTPVRLPSGTSPSLASAAASASGGNSASSSSSPSVSPSYSPASGSSSPQTGSGSLSAWSQCGGTYRCSSNCADAAYTDIQCGSGLTCMRSDSTWWQCRPAGQQLSSSQQSSGSQQILGSQQQSSSSSSSTSSSSSSTSASSGASASANGGTLAYGGNLGSQSSDSSSSGSGASATASAGRKMLRR